MTPAEFIRKWTGATLSERASAQPHFLDLCRLLGVAEPAAVDKHGNEYTFEKHVSGLDVGASKGAKGAGGFVDAWWRGKFAWEYKRQGKHPTLTDALRQLRVYRDALDNPPLLVVSDIDRIEIHTNFTGYKPETHTIALADLDKPESIDKLRRVFNDPESFRPELTVEQVTEDVAKEIGDIAKRLRDAGHDPHTAAHFLMKVMFCLFAEDVELLPTKLFEQLLNRFGDDPALLRKRMDDIFAAMREGGYYGNDPIAYFNGGLFDDAPALELTPAGIEALKRAAAQDWAAVEPSVFGTLFERSLDPDKRSQIGAHYTSREDIMLVIEPVIVRPLRREWEDAKASIEADLEKRRTVKTPAAKKKADERIFSTLDSYLHRLASVRVLDPACGSGNFLYVAIQQLLELEKEAITYAASPEIAQSLIPRVRPTQLLGIEINPYAAELAQVVIWIGYLQWMRFNGFNAPRNPILDGIDTIEQRDAILAWADVDGNPIPTWREGAVCLGQTRWPEADFIVGNPPFLGSKLFRKFGLPNAYIDSMYAEYAIANTSDLCTYWFDRAWTECVENTTLRVGLIATQGIRGQFSRGVLERIVDAGSIYFAWSDRLWVLDGAAVQVSMVGFSATETGSELDGLQVERINANLTSGADLTTAKRLGSNAGIAFMGNTKGGAFDMGWEVARDLLVRPNPHGVSNDQVLRPWVNGIDLTRRTRSRWLIDFNVNKDRAAVASYEAPFGYLSKHVRPEREKNRRKSYAEYWWLHAEPRPALRDAIGTDRFIVTPNLTKYRFFVFAAQGTIPDHQLFAFARSDNYFFGALHSSIHELWARRQGTQLREAESGFRYTPTTCFETFPLPWSPGAEPAEGDPLRPLHDAIAEAAKELDTMRERWLNPPELVEPIAERVDAEDDFADVARVSGEEARRLIRQSAIDAACAKDPALKKRTLTNLYNERPTWLRLAHEKLDRAVLAAYAATDPEGSWDADWATVFTDTGAGQPLPEGHPLSERRAEVEQFILAALLRLNHERASTN